MVDGVAVEVFWDAHNWLFGPSHGDAIFMFKTRESGEELWERQKLFMILTHCIGRGLKDSVIPSCKILVSH